MDPKRWQIGWKATGNLLIVFALLALSVGTTLWMIGGIGGEIALLQQLLLLIEIVGLAAIGVMLYFFHRRVLEPLEQLTRDAEAVAAGDFHRTIEGSDRDDEIGSLTRSVREMRDHLLELFEDARTFERAVEEAGHSVVITDGNETIEYVNPAFERITGYDESEALGRTPRILKSGETDEAVYEEMWKTLELGETWEGEIINEAKGGELQYTQQTIAPIEDENGEIDHYVSIGTDVTDDKLRNQVLEVYNRVLRHNLRNRVNVVTGNAEIVRDDQATRLERLATELENTAESCVDRPEAIRDIRTELEEVSRSLEELAETVRNRASTVAEAGKRLKDLNEKASKADHITRFKDGQDRHLPLSDHLEDQREVVTDRYPDATVALSLPIDGTVPCKDSVRTAIDELVENAVQHNDNAHPRVELSMEIAGDDVVVTVADDGPGIPEHERAVLREGEETPLAHGSGLGLWLVYWIVTLNGGQLTIRDNDPRGTVVKLRLPYPQDIRRENVAAVASDD